MPIIYLSPSIQPFNEYNGGGNEQQYMNLVADAMEPYLRTNGIQFTRNTPDTSLGQAIRESNAGYYDLHLALHSNAAPPSLAGKMRGTDVYYYTYSPQGKAAAEIIAENYKNISPDPSKVRTMPTTKLAEITKTNAPAVLIETEYHDNPDGANWIRDNIQKIAENLVQSLTIYFRLPFISPPQPERQGRVKTQGSNLNLRSRPDLDAPIIGQMPNGASIAVQGEWQNWYVVTYGGSTGYASGDFIEVV